MSHSCLAMQARVQILINIQIGFMQPALISNACKKLPTARLLVLHLFVCECEGVCLCVCVCVCVIEEELRVGSV